MKLLSYKTFRGGSAWIILIIGIFLYYLGYFHVTPNTIWKEIVIKVADVLVIGVILGYLSNAAQFLGVFKQDLEDIIYGKQFLKKRNDIANLWENVSLQMFKEKFPAISKELLTTIKNSYLPLNEVSYYHDYKVIIELSWADDEHNFIIAKDTINFDLIADSTNSFRLPLGSWVNVEGLNEGDYYTRVLDYQVNGKPAKKVEETNTYDPKTHIFKHEYIVELSGATKYEITKVREKKYLFDKDFDICFRAKYLVNKLNVQIRYPDDLAVCFISRGTTEDFKDVNSSKGHLEKQYKGIILPRQGYVFALNRK